MKVSELLRPGDPGYDSFRRIWNGAIDRRPAFIARCASSAEVSAAVRFAAEHDLLLSVKGGGHSIPGWSVCEGGVMIDLSPLKQVRIDPNAGLAQVGPGALWRDYDAAAQAHWLASPGGEVSHTGVAGLTLGGGVGWLSRSFGLACDSLVGAEVVLADGSIVEASEERSSELFWALRGGGGNFGVVTRFDFRLRKVPPMMAGFVMYPAEQASEVLAHFEEVARGAPDALSLVAALINAPPSPPVPPPLRLQPVLAIAACFVGDAAQGTDAVRALRAFGAPVVDTFAVQRYVDIQRWFDDSVPAGLHYHCRSEWLKSLDEPGIARLIRAGRSRTSPLSQVLLRRLGGAISRAAPDATAFRFRDAHSMLTLAAAWDPRDEHADRHRAWCRAAWESMQPWSEGGGYVNHLTDEGAERVRQAYGEATWRRLVKVKQAYDPENLFRMNQNIPPNG